MAYCTIDFYLSLFPQKESIQLSDDFGMESENQTILQICIDVAAAEMALSLPSDLLPPYPIILQVMNAKLARRELHNRLGNVPQYIIEDVTAETEKLQKIKSGELFLTGVSQSKILSYSRNKIYTTDTILA